MLSDSKAKNPNRLKSLCLTLLVIFCLASMTLNVSASDSELDVNSSQVGTVTVNFDGKAHMVAINGRTTVGEILDGLGVSMGEMDEIDTPLEKNVQKDDVINLLRRGYSNKVVEGALPHQTVYYYSQDVTPGTEEVLVEGRDGVGTETYKQFVVDGVVEEETLIATEYTVEPITEEIGIGFTSKPISGMDFKWTFSEEREPVNTVNVLRDQRSTAYTANDGARTASGLEAKVGHVAVNPKVIPYGSKLFIQSSDGKNIYGYAIAADTGGALMSGAAAVDLYYDTMGECVSHGVKTVDIFVLETP